MWALRRVRCVHISNKQLCSQPIKVVTSQPIGHFSTNRSITVNGRDYRVPSSNQSLFGIIMDGSSMDYIDEACAAGAMPHLMNILGRKLIDKQSINQSITPAPLTKKYHNYYTTNPSASRGVIGHCSSAMPSYTNPNNVSIMTGRPPSVHGICGNYYYDRETNQSISMNDPSMLRADSIFAALQRQGVDVTIITVKDKLARLLGVNLNQQDYSADIVSMEALQHDQGAAMLKQIEQRHSLTFTSLTPPPSIYTPMCSVRALELARDLALQRINQSFNQSKPSFYLVSTTDYVQHRYAPGHKVSNEFYAGVDQVIGSLDLAGVRLTMTADHGMNDKHRQDGYARCLYLTDELTSAGFSNDQFHVILPITDPHVVHHGNLGSYACIYAYEPSDRQLIQQIMSKLRSLRGVYTVMSASEASKALDLPVDRIGDIVLIADRDTVVGRTKMEADQHPAPLHLRSHGGLDEMQVPMFANFKLADSQQKLMERGKLRNYDMMELLLNA